MAWVGGKWIGIENNGQCVLWWSSGKGSRKSLEEVVCRRCSHPSPDLIVSYTVNFCWMTQCCMGQDCPSVLLYMMHSKNNINIRIQSCLSHRDLLSHLLHTSTTYSIISMCKFNTAATLSLSTIPCHSTSCINIINFSLSSAMPVHLRTSAPRPHFYNSYTCLFRLFSYPTICLSELQKLQSHPSFEQKFLCICIIWRLVEIRTHVHVYNV